MRSSRVDGLMLVRPHSVVTVKVAHPVELKAATDRWLALSELRRAQDGASWEIRLTQPFWCREQSDDQKTGDN